MATEVIWTPQARQDIDAIRAYYLDIAPAFADIIVDKLLASTRRLETYPLSGRAVPEIEDEALREIIYRELSCDLLLRRNRAAGKGAYCPARISTVWMRLLLGSIND